MQRQSLNPRLDRIPQPVSLSFRLKKEPVAPELAPYRLNPSSALQSIDSNSGLTTMKLELSNIRKEVERLGCSEDEPKASILKSSNRNPLEESFRMEFVNMRSTEHMLREELGNLRKALKENQSREQNRLKELEGRFVSEKTELQSKISQLEGRLKTAPQNS